MIERLKEELNRKEPTDFHNSLLSDCRAKIRASQSRMQNEYCRWDRHDDVYKGIIRYTNKKDYRDDAKSVKRGEPIKSIDTLTYAQCNTWVAIAYMFLTQREYLYELIATGPEDALQTNYLESILEGDLEYNNFKGSILPQLLLSFCKRGVAIAKHQWYKDCVYEEQEVVVEPNVLGRLAEAFGKPPETKTEVKELVEFMGNKITIQSPYRFYPDPRVPLDRFQEGEYCGSENEFTYNYLRRQQQHGKYAGVQHLRDFDRSSGDEYYAHRRISFRGQWGQTYGGRSASSKDEKPKLPIIVTEVQIDVVPKEYILSDGKPLGNQDYPVRYLVEYANDQRIINVEPLVYNWFTYEVAQFNPDESDYVGMGLADALEHIQDIITWFGNVRVDNVKKVIANKLVVDPNAIRPEDLDGRKNTILVDPAYSGRPVGEFIQQLNLTDVTVNHITDMQVLRTFAKEATGIDNLLLGQSSAGRRSAQQDAQVGQNAMARVKISVDNFWHSLVKPMGKKMARNHQQYLDVPRLVKFRGLDVVDTQTGQLRGDIPSMVNVTKEDLVGNYDFKVYEGTLPSERFQLAQTMQELVIGIMQNPQMGQVAQLDPRKMLMDILKYRGVPNPEQYALSMDQVKQLYQPFLDQQTREKHDRIEENIVGELTSYATGGENTTVSGVGTIQGTGGETTTSRGVSNEQAPIAGTGLAGLFGGVNNGTSPNL